jgi:hypothetical protein
MEYPQNLFSASTAALFCDKKTDPSPYTFRLLKKGSSKVVFGPASWGVSTDLLPRMWLRENGFDMSDVDKVERLLLKTTPYKEDRDFISLMNRKLLAKNMQLGIAQKDWMMQEIEIIAKIPGLKFITRSHAISVLTMWHHIEYKITPESDFTKKWSSSEYKDHRKVEEFLSTFLSWKIFHDKKYGKTKESCCYRYGIIVDKIIF